MHVCFNNGVCAWQQPRAVSAALPLPGLGAQSLLLPSSQSTWPSAALRCASSSSSISRTASAALTGGGAVPAIASRKAA